jgi:diguanylate cyclase (GGDEF)-like protein
VGDAVLTAFAQACAAHLRSSERLGRYGGEEFLLIMPGSDAAQVPIVFHRLQQAVAAMAVPGLPAQRRVTFSMGAAETWGDHDTLSDLIHRADEALYRAKQNGRDRCESASHVRLVGAAPADGGGGARPSLQAVARNSRL